MRDEDNIQVRGLRGVVSYWVAVVGLLVVNMFSSAQPAMASGGAKGKCGSCIEGGQFVACCQTSVCIFGCCTGSKDCEKPT